MRTAERGENQFSGVRLARRHLHMGAPFIDIADTIDIAEIEAGMNAMSVHVQRDSHDIDIAGALAVSEERSFDPLGAGQKPEFRRRDPGSAIVVSVQRDHGAISPRQMPAHPFDLIRMHIWRRVLHGRRKIENDLILDRWLPDVGDRLTDLQSEIELRTGETLRRILKTHIRTGGCQRLACTP